MAWSTQQLADLAGSTVKAVRYYHRIGLLAEPERTSNGYKQYDTTHLVRAIYDLADDSGVGAVARLFVVRGPHVAVTAGLRERLATVVKAGTADELALDGH